MTTKTLFIGLDGCTYTVLDKLTQDQPGEGVVMPFLAGLMEKGARAKLFSTPNPLTPPAWTSIMTGRTPGHHGVYDFIRAEDKGGEVFWTLYDGRDIACETIWSLVSRSGGRIAALNFPLTAPPPEGVNGTILPGFIPAKHLRRNTHPREAFQRLKDNIDGFDPKELAWDFESEKQALEKLSDNDMESWVRYHLPREEQWFRVAEYILENDAPELMAVMFDGTDKIQHQAWAFLDPELFPAEPTEFDQRMRNVCLEYFRNVDRYIERLVTLAGPEVQVFFASDHGFTATTEVLRINRLLADLGYLEWAESDGSDQALRREAADFANLNWARTTAYCRTPSSNGIHIRLAEKPGDSGVPVEQYQEFREELVNKLLAVKNEHGEPVIIDVLRREEHFPGPFMMEAPDLTLVLRDHGFVSIKNLSPAVIQRDRPAGTHHPDGIFMASGPGVKAGRVERRRIVDVTASLVYSLGLPVPKDYEGEVPAGFFTEEWMQEHPVVIGEVSQAAAKRAPTEDMDEGEKKQLLEQLQMLGYME